MPVTKSYEAQINHTGLVEGKSMAKFRNIYVDVTDFINDDYTESPFHTWSTKKLSKLAPTQLSQLNNDLGFLTADDAKAFAEEYIKSLALDYYLKNEVYTKEEILEMISQYSNMKTEFVTELPEKGEERVIYLVPSQNPNEDDKNTHDEYIWINDDWEYIGDTTIDLSNIYTKAETEEVISRIIDDSDISDTTAWSSERIVEYMGEYIQALDRNWEEY